LRFSTRDLGFGSSQKPEKSSKNVMRFVARGELEGRPEVRGSWRKEEPDFLFSKTLQLPGGPHNHTETKTNAFLDRLRNRENPQNPSWDLLSAEGFSAIRRFGGVGEKRKN
jgi:hypothetical protein